MNQPFECENCGHKPTAYKVVELRATCEKCGDSVITYTVDAAECIAQLHDRVFELEHALALASKHANFSQCDPEVEEAVDAALLPNAASEPCAKRIGSDGLFERTGK